MEFPPVIVVCSHVCRPEIRLILQISKYYRIRIFCIRRVASETLTILKGFVVHLQYDRRVKERECNGLEFLFVILCYFIHIFLVDCIDDLPGILHKKSLGRSDDLFSLFRRGLFPFHLRTVHQFLVFVCRFTEMVHVEILVVHMDAFLDFVFHIHIPEGIQIFVDPLLNDPVE